MGAEVGTGTKSEPNVVPLCDILLVLLIIFMVITPVAQKGIDINLPESSSGGTEGEPPSATKSIVLTLEADQSLDINNRPVTLDLLESELRTIYQTRTTKTIFIRADETVLYESVLKVIDIAKGAGIEVLGVIPERYQSAQ
ncbi:MAG: biopolymer transporter ExbD [Acidobacteriota bacterium]|jgi:biopolymer transport protein ExbD|nr:biopolymer transporter ExbD [Acidobacteriota bacterium]